MCFNTNAACYYKFSIKLNSLRKTFCFEEMKTNNFIHSFKLWRKRLKNFKNSQAMCGSIPVSQSRNRITLTFKQIKWKK